MTPQETISALGLDVAAEFVPFSKSRNAKEAKTASDLSLNWRIIVSRNGREILATDYMQGIGHAPAYKASTRALGNANSLLRFEALQYEAENGRRAPVVRTFGGKRLDAPSAADVLYSLTSDASALDHPTFESWAGDFGYSEDSREAERIYRACLDIGLKLRTAIGEHGLEQLREAFQDY